MHARNTASKRRRKSGIRLPFVMLLAISGAVAAAGAAFAGIVNSAHDFSSGGTGGPWGTPDTDRICVFCHTPHQAQPVQAPLWNRQDTTSTFKTYGSPTLDASVGQPTGNSRLCLSCHDGSVAVDAYVAGGPAIPHMMAIGDVYYPGSPYGEGGPNIGGNYSGNASVNDLRNDHPVSFIYDDGLAAADGDLRAPSSLPPNLPLFQGRLECATCHDAHNVETVGGTRLLRISNQGSVLCLTCHLK
ncbi:MAG: cytochrome C [Deltaproteobacteria bacterium]|nr:cytochrome C [Deltaproteobacteria bacterium]